MIQRDQARARPGYTYIELMISVVVLAIVTMLVIPDDNGAEAQELDSAAGRLEADVAFARSWSVARPDDPVILKADAANNRYWIAKQSAPDTPVTHPMTGKPYIVQFGSNGVADGKHITLHVLDLGGDSVLAFDSSGATDQSTAAVLKVSVGTAGYEVSVSPAAAQVKIIDARTRGNARVMPAAPAVAEGVEGGGSTGGTGGGGHTLEAGG